RRVQSHDVLSQLDNVPPPEVADVAAERDAVGAVVVDCVDPAVDLARREHEAAALAERHDLLHEVFALADHSLLIWRRNLSERSWRSRWCSSWPSRTRSTSPSSSPASLRRRYRSMSPTPMTRSTLSAWTGVEAMPGRVHSGQRKPPAGAENAAGASG